MSKRKYNQIIGKLRSIDCAGTHVEKIGYSNSLVEGDPINYIDEHGNIIETGEIFHITDYVEDNPNAKIVNNKYVVEWI